MKRKNLQFEDLFISNIPTAEMYERSYMHRDTVTHTLVANKVDFIITASAEGRIKFWKKNKGTVHELEPIRVLSCVQMESTLSRPIERIVVTSEVWVLRRITQSYAPQA